MEKTQILRRYFLAVAERPIFTAALVIFSIFLINASVRMLFTEYLSVSQIAIQALLGLFILGIWHIIFAKQFTTRFSKEIDKIIILESEGRAFTYEHPVWGKVPYWEIIFPDHWDVSHKNKNLHDKILLGVYLPNRIIARLEFDFFLEIRDFFQPADLIKLIENQRKLNPEQIRFDFVDCLQDFLVVGGNKNSHSLYLLLMDYFNSQINFTDLEKGVLQIMHVPKIFSNVNKSGFTLRGVEFREIVYDSDKKSNAFAKAYV